VDKKISLDNPEKKTRRGKGKKPQTKISSPDVTSQTGGDDKQSDEEEQQEENQQQEEQEE